MEQDTPIVSILCTAYNHAPYIAQTLDGFVMQRCGFPFEVIVHDDASTDDTASIVGQHVQKYPNLFVAIFQEKNQYSQCIDIVDLLFGKARGKYVALCEGDDYWTDPLKLQKQVDFLEANPQYVGVYGKIKMFRQKSGKFIGTYGAAATLRSLIDVGNTIPTLTMLFRRDSFLGIRDMLPNPLEKGWKMGDYQTWVCLSSIGSLKFFDEFWGVYRVLEKSSSNSKDPENRLAFFRSFCDINLHYTKLFFPDRVEQIQLLRQDDLLKEKFKINLNYRRIVFPLSVSECKDLYHREKTRTNCIILLAAKYKSIIYFLYRNYLRIRNKTIM